MTTEAGLPGTTPAFDAVATAVRADLPILRPDGGPPLVYLDSAATSLTPEPVIDAITGYYRDVGASVHRGKHMLSDIASTRFEQVRAQVATEVGGGTRQVAFVPNTTAALNTVAAGLPLDRGDLVLAPLDVHHSNLLPWRARATVRMIPLTPEATPDLGAYAELLRLRPKVVAVSACSNVTGRFAPAEEMARMAHEAGALFVLDAAQSAPHGRIRLAATGADYAAFSAHKMLGPTGIGILYGRLAELAPSVLGGGTVDWVDLAGHRLRDEPHHLEPGTPHVAGVYGLGATLDYLRGLGWDAVAAHDATLTRLLYEEIARRPYLRPLGGPGHRDRAAIASLRLPPGADVDEVARMLSDSYRVMCRSGKLCAQPMVDGDGDGRPVLRISAYVYTTPEELGIAFAALDEVLTVTGVPLG
ncbi:aminotransferase class V-fold PLP-dependent enzyme [Actinomadura gamaensis]|uniref:Aminotransferase class V-fold PLP-dependent enzyme n=1 Tax=Actinomadura gamaensis TaxID=1763541 RepID=A0ABV9TWB1_9ACTN